MAAIAPDELRHAELAGELAAWYATQLSAEARQRVAHAKATAIDEREYTDCELAGDAGIPGRADSARLLAGLRATVWA
jgi:hypothetical protein